uniref:Uncharacterized protein n=1 Tax=Setaria viridis TaxID=4556 RepID=A0A4U6WCX7_SETVI|nr:hypothetical protein SEVIR_2G389940v2 [Setaria viridis]
MSCRSPRCRNTPPCRSTPPSLRCLSIPPCRRCQSMSCHRRPRDTTRCQTPSHDRPASSLPQYQ